MRIQKSRHRKKPNARQLEAFFANLCQQTLHTQSNHIHADQASYLSSRTIKRLNSFPPRITLSIIIFLFTGFIYLSYLHFYLFFCMLGIFYFLRLTSWVLFLLISIYCSNPNLRFIVKKSSDLYQFNLECHYQVIFAYELMYYTISFCMGFKISFLWIFLILVIHSQICNI